MCDAITPFLINSIQEMRERTLLLLLRKQLIGVLSFLNKNYFTSSIISFYFNSPLLHKTIIRVKIIVCMETPFSKNSYLVETSQMIFNANQLTGFYMIRGFTEKCLQKDYSHFFPNYYTQSKRNTRNSSYPLTNMRFI